MAEDKNEISERYVAFCDILGFSSQILTNFDETLEVYKQFGNSMAEFPIEEVQATMYSDAILITSNSLGRLLSAVQALWFLALGKDFMIRGAITKGRYWEERKGNHLLVASDALVRAVKLEKSIGVPAVVLADDIEVPDLLWAVRYVDGLFITPLLHFRDRNVVNPFNQYWFASAAMRTSQLMAKYPAYQDKYLWFLALHDAVGKGHDLTPPDTLNRLIEAGVLEKKDDRKE